MMLCVEPESLSPLQAELHLPQEGKEEDVTDGVIIVYKSDLWMYPNLLVSSVRHTRHLDCPLQAGCSINPNFWIYIREAGRSCTKTHANLSAEEQQMVI